ncbi:Myb-like_DNA-binding domain-containing protein [Hexamita inflata]|uniref:Myb-like DNA-binding domain-containing protein n=1 Tax=Hexamita inflata TaxID=28002 RepID=A0AA86UTS0_9EUKA|nr:Myb-like DNA-binding domain-containing protein [Hexamita inflata]
MNSNPDKTKYILWSDSEIKKLNQVVQKVTQGKTYTNWHKVAEEMAPRTLQQCKSYYGQLTNQSGTLKQKFSQVVQKPVREFDAEVVFKSLPVEQRIQCYTLPNYYNFEWTKVQYYFGQFSIPELKQLYEAASSNVQQQKQFIKQVEDNKLQPVSTVQLKYLYCNLQQAKYGLLLEELRLKNTDPNDIPPIPATYDGYNFPIQIKYPPQPHLVWWYKEIFNGFDIEKALFHLVIELSHRVE